MALFQLGHDVHGECAHILARTYTFLRTHTCVHVLAHTYLRTHNDLRTHVREESSRSRRQMKTPGCSARKIEIRKEVDLEGAFNAAEGGNRGVEM